MQVFSSADAKVAISDDLRYHLPPLTADELETLTTSIVSEGIRDPLVAWTRGVDDLVLLDGHNRYSVCLEHDIEYTFVTMDFSSLDDAQDWVDKNQLARRNLSDVDRHLVFGRVYNCRKQQPEANLKKGQKASVSPKGQVDPSGKSTAEQVAAEFGVSPSTLKRAGVRAEVHDAVFDVDSDAAEAAKSLAHREIVAARAAADTPSKLANELNRRSELKQKGDEPQKPLPEQQRFARSKVVKTIEAAMRAIDDYHDVCADTEQHGKVLESLRTAHADVWGVGVDPAPENEKKSGQADDARVAAALEKLGEFNGKLTGLKQSHDGTQYRAAYRLTGDVGKILEAWLRGDAEPKTNDAGKLRLKLKKELQRSVRTLDSYDEAVPNEDLHMYLIRGLQRIESQIWEPHETVPRNGHAVTSASQLAERLVKQHVSPLVRGIDSLRDANGGAGAVYREADETIERLIQALKKMRRGEK